MEELFQYGGYIEIDRTGSSEGDVMKLPHSFDVPGVLSKEEIEKRMTEYASEWLAMLADTAPGHRGDYGVPGKVVITSFIPLFSTE